MAGGWARRSLVAALGALALLALGGQPVLAGGGGHVRALLSTDPATPTAGDTVAVLLRFTADAAPAEITAYATPPGAGPLRFRMERIDEKTLRGSFFADRGGRWEIYASISGASELALEVRGSPVVLAQPRAGAPELPVGLVVALALLPYALAVPIWLAVRPRTPATSYHMTRLDLERKVA